MNKKALKSYCLGFILSILLTLLAYFTVVNQAVSERDLFAFILTLALMQLFVQLLFFLHLGRESRPRWNLIFFVSTVGIIFIIVVGSLWIMNHLNYNMMPEEMKMYIQVEEGIHQNIATLFRNYYNLTKPGIIYGNAITAAAGFFLASNGQINLLLLAATLIGISFIIASSCVFNNFIDRKIDQKMKRTKKRAFVTGAIPAKNAILFGLTLGLLGFGILYLFTNLLTVFIGIIGVFFYVVMYSIWKRRSAVGTLVGSVSGAAPIAGGYCAVTNSFDLVAVLLFLILITWQMPHFYSIAIYRIKEYGVANIPVLPIAKGIESTKLSMLGYIFTFILITLALSVIGETGLVYLISMTSVGIFWIINMINGFKTTNDEKWARKMFKLSLIVIIVFSFLISVNAYLP